MELILQVSMGSVTLPAVEQNEQC